MKIERKVTRLIPRLRFFDKWYDRKATVKTFVEGSQHGEVCFVVVGITDSTVTKLLDTMESDLKKSLAL